MKNLLKYINRNGIVSSLIASIIFTLVIYYFNVDKRKLTFKEVTHEMLYNNDENFGLIIYTNDSIKLNKHIYYLEVDVWNQGNQPIEENDIKEYFGLKLMKGYTFLSSTKIIETHRDVTKAEVLFDSTKGVLYLNFDFLEKNNGIKIKSYYISDLKEKSIITPLGYIAQNTEIKYFNSTFTEKYRSWISILVWLIGILLILYVGNKISNKIHELIEKYFSKYILNFTFRKVIGVIAYLIILWYFLVNVLAKTPRWIYEFINDQINRDSPF